MPYPNKITQFKNGEVANPKGRPKGSLNRATLYRRFLDLEGQYVNPLTGEEENLSIAERMAISVIRKGLEGDLKAVKEAFDSGFGKSAEKPIDDSNKKNFVILEWSGDIDKHSDDSVDNSSNLG
jgi:hypothetical protein